jgi:hypothetical protein
MGEDWWLALTLSMPTALMGLTAVAHRAQRRQEDQEARLDEGWAALARDLELTFLREHTLGDRVVERAVIGRQAGLEARLEVSTGMSGSERQTRALVDLQVDSPRCVSVFERGLGPARGGDGARTLTGDAGFDRAFALYTEGDPCEACALLRVEARAALLRLAALTRRAGGDRHGLAEAEGCGAWLRRGQLGWVIPGALGHVGLLREALEAALEAGVALRGAAFQLGEAAAR